MVSPPPRKRPASRSPEPTRNVKRLITSSPEEGEVDDNPPPVVKPTILPIALPQKPTTSGTKGMPFPFKKKLEPPKGGVGVAPNDRQGKTLNVFEELEEKQAKKKDDMPKQPPRHAGKPNGGDHWEPPLPGHGGSLLSRMAPLPGGSQFASTRDNTRDHRDRGRRSPTSHYSPRRRSPSPHQDNRHRLPEPSNFSPLNHYAEPRDRSRERGRERVYERDRTRSRSRSRSRSRDNYGRRDDYPRRYRDDRQHYRNDHRHDSRAWTRDEGYSDRRGSDRGYNDRRYDNKYTTDSYRPVSPRAPSPGFPPLPLETPAPPSTSPPPPPPPPADNRPRPPSSTPPPAPPPDTRLKDEQLPPIQSHVKITMKRPDAPSDRHSPPPLDLPSVSTAKAMANGPEHKDASSRSQQQDQREHGEVKDRPREPERPKLPLIRRKIVQRRPVKLETQAYGHGFVGCGLQSDYEATTKLGEGTFGEVHKAIQKSTGVVVALKRILMHNEKEGMPVTALREIKILKALKHPSIISILDMFVVRSTEKDPLSVYMVFPYMDHDLAGLLENERVKLQPSHIKLYMKQLLEGTEYMHRNHILHRDMKAANLLISNDGTLRIADFGLARSFDSGAANAPRADGSQRSRDRKYTNCVVTRWYRPPELLLGTRHYGGEVDIWGIGCVLGEMFTRRPILPGTSDLDQLEKIWVLCGAPNQHNWPHHDLLPGCEGVTRFNSQPRRLRQTYERFVHVSLYFDFLLLLWSTENLLSISSVGPETVDLLDKLLMLNPRDRLTAAQALEHDYFWTDPLPADPKTLPTYEASHEFDKRGHRNHQPMPQGPPPGIHHVNQQRPHGNPPFNRGGPSRGQHFQQQQQHPYGGGGMDRRGPRQAFPPGPPNGPHPTFGGLHPPPHHNLHHGLPPPPSFGAPNNNLNTNFNNNSSNYNHGPSNHNYNQPVPVPGPGGLPHPPAPFQPGLVPLIPGSFPNGNPGPGGVPLQLPRPPHPNSMPFQQGYGPGPGPGRGPGPRGDRRDYQRGGGGGGGNYNHHNHAGNAPSGSGGMKLPLAPGLPLKPVSGPVSGGVAMGIPNRDRDRDRGDRDRGDKDGRDYDRHRGPPPPPPMRRDDSEEGASGDALNYG
ncbi:hypothetical protein CVT25_009912 [Psilocybe cyanescens]|uniref:Protein kinase domain-containing protein n=1 Tax=Psilocybe cyanescens TaxID=93625 RepID=A0A409XCN2_PSICY|nr:hypothetical protein CVT25_009912 [Psilocybe cyanescens]